MAAKKAHILLVDDEPSILQTATIVLESLGFTIETAMSGEVALNLLAENANRFDLVMTDFSMPDIDGREMVHRARKLGPMPPFVVVSGYVLDEEHLGDDFIAYILKPFRIKDLSLRLNELLESLS